MSGHPLPVTDDDMLRKLLASGIHKRLIAQKMKRSIGAIQSRIFLLKSPESRLHRKPDLPNPHGRLVPQRNQRFRSHRSRESQLNACPTGGFMLGGLGKRRLIGGVVVSLVITLLLSLGAVYGLNRYLGPVEEPGWTTGSVRR